MTIFNSLAEVRVNQFKNRRLQTEHHYSVQFGANYTTGDFVRLFRNGRAQDDDSEPDGIYLPTDSGILLEVSANIITSFGSMQLVYYGIQEANNDGGTVTINGETSFPANEINENSGSASNAVELDVLTFGGEELLHPKLKSAVDEAFGDVTLRVLSYTSYPTEGLRQFIDA